MSNDDRYVRVPRHLLDHLSIRGLLLVVLDRLDQLQETAMSTEEDIAAVSAKLDETAASLASIDASTTETADAVDALQAYVESHPDVDPALAELVSKAQTVAQDASGQAAMAAAVAQDASSTFPAAPPADGGTEPPVEPPA